MRVKQVNGRMEMETNEQFVESIKAFMQDPNPQIVKPKLAATVLLVRDSVPGEGGLRIEDDIYPEEFPSNQTSEVFMLRRKKSMSFLPDAVAFPGGRVDERDSNPHLSWRGPSPAQWGKLLDLSEPDARKVVVAAARELFEETGVLLASMAGEDPIKSTDDPVWMEYRKNLVSHELSLADMLIERGLVLRTDLLGLVYNFCTPPSEKKRFDTFFFSALLPEGQAADGITSEAQEAHWVTPAYAVREADAKNWLIVPPTMCSLTKLANATSARAFSKQRPALKKLIFEPVEKEGGEIKIACG